MNILFKVKSVPLRYFFLLLQEVFRFKQKLSTWAIVVGESEARTCINWLAEFSFEIHFSLETFISILTQSFIRCFFALEKKCDGWVVPFFAFDFFFSLLDVQGCFFLSIFVNTTTTEKYIIVVSRSIANGKNFCIGIFS